MTLAEDPADLLLGVGHVLTGAPLIEIAWTDRGLAWLTPSTFFWPSRAGS